MKGLLPFGVAAIGVVALVSGCASTASKVDDNAATMECGQLGVKLAFEGDSLTLAAAGKQYHMNRVKTASGTKYEVAGDPSTSFWSKGSRATLEVDGTTLPECQVIGAVVEPFQASGNEPFWQILADNGQLQLTRTRHDAVIIAPYKITGITGNGSTLQAEVEGARMQLDVARQICKDSMSGMNYPFQVKFELDGEVMNGCGGDPGRLLQGVEWVVEDIGGNGIIDSSRVTLNFLPEGRVAGRASCNQFMGSYSLTGEGMSIDNAATTLMACAPALMDQERRFLDVISQVSGFDFNQHGALILRTDDGKTLRAFTEH